MRHYFPPGMRILITGVVPFGGGGCTRGFKGCGSMEMLLATVVLSWEGEIGHGFLPSVAPPPSGDGVLGRRPLSEDMRGRVLVVTLDFPLPRQNLGIASALSLGGK